MKRILLISVFLSLILSCGGRKQVERALNSGNYDQAINNSLKKLETNKDKKRKQDYIILLQDAFYKAVENDLTTIKYLKKDNNPERLSDIYETYIRLDSRQDKIKPVLPLVVNGKSVQFKFKDYSNDMVNYRNKTSDYLYNKGSELLKSNNKLEVREAYGELEYVETINPNYKNTRMLMQQAHNKGSNYVIVSIENQTQQIIPQRLQDDLLNFDTYRLNKFWTVYHANPNQNINYDLAMQLQLKQINISPEQVRETEFLREKEIKDGWEYQLDSDGNVVKDSLGNDIKVDKFVNITARYLESHQIKTTQILADVVYLDLISKQVIDRFTIDSGFVFENVFGSYRGDKRALTDEDRNIINNNRMMPFPSDEQMVYDTGEDLKYKLKKIISSNNF